MYILGYNFSDGTLTTRVGRFYQTFSDMASGTLSPEEKFHRRKIRTKSLSNSNFHSSCFLIKNNKKYTTDIDLVSKHLIVSF